MKRQGPLRGLGWIVAVAVMLAMPSGATAAGQTLLSDAFSGATTSSPVLAEPNPTTSSTGLPCLTAGVNTATQPVPGCGEGGDAVGSGVLRLTGNIGSQASSLVFDGSFPTSAGLNVTFDEYQYPGGGDGLSFDLAAGPPVPTSIGGAGGGLGYGGAPGLPAGYLGVGLDVFGNFSSTLTDGAGCSDPSWASTARNPNQVVVRGPGNGTTGYCLVAGTESLQPDPMSTIALDGANRTASRRGVNIRIDPNADTFTVGIDPNGGTSYQTVLTGALPAFYFAPATGARIAGLPPRLVFAFAGATGGVTDIHEIGNVNATTLTSVTPALTLGQTDLSGGTITPGSTVTYRLTAGVSSASAVPETEPTTMILTDPLPAGETLHGAPSGTGWNCSASTPARVSCTNTSSATVARGTLLPPVAVPVTVSGAATAPITNIATVSSADAAGQVSASDTVQLLIAGGNGPAATTTALSCSPGTVLIGAVSTCIATVSDAVGGSPVPTGTVQFTSAGGQFAGGGSCTLAPVADQAGAAACHSADTVASSGDVRAAYGGDAGHLGSGATTGVATAPVAGRTATVQVTGGVVLIHIPGRNGYHLLSSGSSSIPVGATIDALKGSVTLDTAGDNLRADNRHHVIHTGAFSEGLFTVKQTATAEQEKSRSTELVLNTPPGAVVQAACRRSGPPGKGVVRTLNGIVKGVYRVVGAASTMSMDNGSFVIQDRCDGTLTKVRKGRATVRYRKTIGRHTRTVSRTLHAGQELLAKERFLADTLAAG